MEKKEEVFEAPKQPAHRVVLSDDQAHHQAFCSSVPACEHI
jgi:hypothetical protein